MHPLTTPMADQHHDRSLAAIAAAPVVQSDHTLRIRLLAQGRLVMAHLPRSGSHHGRQVTVLHHPTIAAGRAISRAAENPTAVVGGGVNACSHGVPGIWMRAKTGLHAIPLSEYSFRQGPQVCDLYGANNAETV